VVPEAFVAASWVGDALPAGEGKTWAAVSDWAKIAQTPDGAASIDIWDGTRPWGHPDEDGIQLGCPATVGIAGVTEGTLDIQFFGFAPFAPPVDSTTLPWRAGARKVVEVVGNIGLALQVAPPEPTPWPRVRARVVYGTDDEKQRAPVESWIADAVTRSGAPFTGAYTDWIELEVHEKVLYSPMQGGRVIKGRASPWGDVFHVAVSGHKIEGLQTLELGRGDDAFVQLTRYPGIHNTFIVLEAPNRADEASAPEHDIAALGQRWADALLQGRVDEVMATSDVPFAWDGTAVKATVEELRAGLEFLVKDKGARKLAIEEAFEVPKDEGVKAFTTPMPSGVVYVKAVIGDEGIIIAVKPGPAPKVVGFRD
jgi:hypothetical protein